MFFYVVFLFVGMSLLDSIKKEHKLRNNYSGKISLVSSSLNDIQANNELPFTYNEIKRNTGQVIFIIHLLNLSIHY